MKNKKKKKMNIQKQYHLLTDTTTPHQNPKCSSEKTFPNFKNCRKRMSNFCRQTNDCIPPQLNQCKWKQHNPLKNEMFRNKHHNHILWGMFFSQ